MARSRPTSTPAQTPSDTPAPPAPWPAHLRSQQLLLRRRTTNDPSPDWLPEAEQAVPGAGDTCPLLDRAQAADAIYWLRPPGAPATEPHGACAARLTSDRDLLWTWLAVDARWRAYGLGGAAVPIIERAALRLGATTGRVLVPASNGIGLYFWLRLGYRPLPGAPWPKHFDGTWMRRTITDRAR